jgi:hypothetical protein
MAGWLGCEMPSWLRVVVVALPVHTNTDVTKCGACAPPSPTCEKKAARQPSARGQLRRCGRRKGKAWAKGQGRKCGGEDSAGQGLRAGVTVSATPGLGCGRGSERRAHGRQDRGQENDESERKQRQSHQQGARVCAWWGGVGGGGEAGEFGTGRGTAGAKSGGSRQPGGVGGMEEEGMVITCSFCCGVGSCGRGALPYCRTGTAVACGLHHRLATSLRPCLPRRLGLSPPPPTNRGYLPPSCHLPRSGATRWRRWRTSTAEPRSTW